jgi:hypothetical protein
MGTTLLSFGLPTLYEPHHVAAGLTTYGSKYSAGGSNMKKGLDVANPITEAMDQRGQTRASLDEAFLPEVPGQRSAAPALLPCL